MNTPMQAVRKQSSTIVRNVRSSTHKHTLGYKISKEMHKVARHVSILNYHMGNLLCLPLEVFAYVANSHWWPYCNTCRVFICLVSCCITIWKAHCHCCMYIKKLASSFVASTTGSSRKRKDTAASSVEAKKGMLSNKLRFIRKLLHAVVLCQQYKLDNV